MEVGERERESFIMKEFPTKSNLNFTYNFALSSISLDRLPPRSFEIYISSQVRKRTGIKRESNRVTQGWGEITITRATCTQDVKRESREKRSERCKRIG